MPFGVVIALRSVAVGVTATCTSFFFPSVFVDTFEENLVFFFQFSMRFENKSHSFLCDLKPNHTVFSSI